MVGSHAQIVNVDRVEGVPYMVLPSSGKSPYGTPDRGGFTGWVRYGVRTAREPRADVRAFAQSIDAHRARGAGGGLDRRRSAASSCSPTASPTARAACRCATRCRCAGRAATASPSAARSTTPAAPARSRMLDPTTRELTALRAGAATVAVEADSMRDGDDLSPIRAQKTIQVAPFVAPPVRGRGRRHVAADALAHARRAGVLRRLHARRRAHVRGVTTATVTSHARATRRSPSTGETAAPTARSRSPARSRAWAS